AGVRPRGGRARAARRLDVPVWRTSAGFRRGDVRALRLVLRARRGRTAANQLLTMTAKSSPEFRIALVGCGRISGFHFDAIAKVSGLRLCAVCDVVEARARAAGE